MRRHAVTLTGLALAVLVGPITLAAADPPNPGYTFSRTPSHGKPGTVIHVKGTGCEYQGKPYDFAAVYLRQPGHDTLAQARYDIAADGSFSGDLKVPDKAPAGKYLLSAECYASDMAFVVDDTDFTVAGPPPSPTPTHTASPTPHPTPSFTPTPRPSATRTPSPRPTQSRTTARALASPSPLVASTSPVAIASNRPAGPDNGVPPALIAAAAVLIAANGVGLRAAARRPRR